MKISYKVPIAASTIVLFAFAIFSAVQYKLTSDNLYKQLNSNMDETAITLDYQISNWLNGKMSLVNSAAQVLAKTNDVSQIVNIINTDESKQSFQLMHFSYEHNGKPIVNDQEIMKLLEPDIDVRVRPWYRLALNHSDVVLTDAYVDETSPYPMISAVAQVEYEGKTLGVVGGDISTKTASAAMNKINFGGAGYIFIADKSGKIVIHPDHKLYGRNISSLLGTGINIDKEAILQEAVDETGKKVLTKFLPMSALKSKDWVIGIVVDKETIMAETYNIARNALIGTILSVILCSLLLYWFMNILVIRPLLSVTDTTNEISRGNMDSEVEGLERQDEIGELSRAVQRMQKSLSIILNRLKK